MDFAKYNSISQSRKKAFTNLLTRQELTDGDCVVQEKVHGANFSIWSSKDEMRFASRNQFLSDYKFNNYKLVIEKYQPGINDLTKKVLDNGANLVILYGEIYGGSYPHEDVKPMQNAIRVQKEVLYCPHNDFYGFDIKVDDQYLGVDECNDLYDEYKIPRAQELYRGSFKDCLEFPNEFPSTISYFHNLPPIDNNICEGVIIKPINSKYLRNGGRFILKNKNDKFSEIKQKKSRQKRNITDKGDDLYKSVQLYITLNRLNAVISKRETTERKDFRKVVGEFVKDIWDDYYYDKDIDDITKGEQKRIKKDIYDESSQLLITYFQDLDESRIKS